MFRKKRYELNTDTLAYEIHKIPLFKRVSKGFVLFLLSLVAFSLYYALYTCYFGYDTPKTAQLKRKSAELHSKIDLLNSRLEKNFLALTELELRDNNTYRPIFGMEEIGTDVRNAGFGGVDRYSYLDDYRNFDHLKSVEMNMDILYKKAFIQSKSYDDVSFFAKRSREMALSVPAIPPVALDKVKYSSTFGYRRDPFSKRLTKHCGLDLSGKTGEPIYATGNGKVVDVSYNFFGYGNYVVIDHGFGYKTRYAHLSKVFVKEGQQVERGEHIANMGNSGKSTGTHLHYEVIYRNNVVNPINYFSNDVRGEEYRAMIKKSDNPLSKR